MESIEEDHESQPKSVMKMSQYSIARKQDMHSVVLGLALVGLFLTGCGESRIPNGDDRSYLKQVCLAYKDCCLTKEKAPESVADLEPYLGGVYYTDSGSYVDNEAHRRLASGEYVVVWGFSLSYSDEKGVVVAYEKRTPLTGGFVVTDAFDVMWMDPEELEAHLLADSGGGTPTDEADE